MGGRGAANEVLRDGLAGELLAQHRMVQEVTLLEEAWVRISTNGAVAYGSESLKKAVQEGAVERLLILADLLRDDSSSCGGIPWSTLVEQIISFGGEIIQCSADHDAGEQLVGFGGAVALLRYAV